MDELIEQFAVEARELVEQASGDLLALEADPGNRERLESAFRAMHTLKGSVGLFELGPMQDVLHQAEDLLSKARAGDIAVDVALIDPLLAVIEWVEECIDGIVETGRLSDVQEKQASRLFGLLTRDVSDRPRDEPDGGEPAAASAIASDWALRLLAQMPPNDRGGSLVAIRYEPHPECFFNGDDPLATISRLPDLRHVELSLKTPPPETGHYDPFRCNLVIEALCGGPLAAVEAALRLIPDQVTLVTLADPAAEASASDTTPARLPERASTTMRVESSRIDTLIEIAGELVTAKNSLVPLAQDARESGNASLARRIHASHQEIERLVGALYGAVTQARMIPLEHSFRRFPKLVRETSAKLGKAIDLVIEGETVEADRDIVESLFEPLLHIVRNSLDHGIEPEDVRKQASKPPRGRIHLQARQRGDRIEIDIADDGRGMDAARVRQAAVERGLITAQDAPALSHRDALQFVFAPGFSTASAVSDLSGRGVGLDVVRRSIERLGGTVEMQSTQGAGTIFTLKLPVSFAMTPLLVIEVGGERFGISMADVIETHKLAANSIQPVRAGKAFVLRDRTIPLLFLADLLRLPARDTDAEDLKVLIVRSGDDDVGIAVDAIAERAQTLTRPLTGLLQAVPGIAGTTLLGDGKVLLVLDLEELIG
ncbi:two-component system chemotaxis sensor kinase CheA [Neorhizobium galegae]|uniref:chemotaxis protein CheA n=1 Tax=Neorhizobium galegae TaxID=399 RepID=UPI001AE5B381|nr:chemotaxis protein CheA [Neorhizobium galegae]MBP2547950.1 two-component system chemotaxis sensor kinase CheA [Neorhizobium galegae]